MNVLGFHGMYGLRAAVAFVCAMLYRYSHTGVGLSAEHICSA